MKEKQKEEKEEMLEEVWMTDEAKLILLSCQNNQSFVVLFLFPTCSSSVCLYLQVME